MDRVIVNSNWIGAFLDSVIEFQALGDSDHCPALVWLHKEALVARLKPFKFFNFWVLHQEFMTVVEESWQASVKKKREELVRIQLANLDSDVVSINIDVELQVERELKTLEEIENQLGVVDQDIKGCDVRMLKYLIHYSLPMGAADALCMDISDVEIKEAIWGPGNDKSPRPDVYNSFLVPKVPNPNMVKDFRLISYCYVIYKTVTGILVSRFVVVFPGMISMNQNAFVKEKSIIGNTLLAQEILRGYARRNISLRCALKIDLQKSFDSLNWEFVGVILHALGLPEKFISLLYKSQGDRGIRQGDPLSPYIFVLAMNVLSSLLNVAAINGIFKFHPKCKKIGFTHLCFDDNMLIFCKGSIDSIIGVQFVLDIFYSMSSLRLNANKCEIFMASVSANQCVSIREVIGFKLGSLPVRYLGVPLVTRKLAVKDCQSLIDKIKSKLNLCANRHLSFAGRLQLVRVVLFSIANYWCRKLILPECWSFRSILKLKHAISHLFVDSGSDIKTGKIWEDMRVKVPKVPWYSLVWFPGCIPKHNIILWMTILDRLPTWVRLLRMELSIENDKCVLCDVEAKTRDHLFFDCGFTRELWGDILTLCGVIRRVSCWDRELACVVHYCKGKSLLVRVFKLAWVSHVYGIWKERNSRLFGGKVRLVGDVLKDIKETIQIRLKEWAISRADPRNDSLYVKWGIS
ncbi:uncharacterized protein LOC120217278 [Hibiscus syriacus]|uniref:uncharacterized protein LOC120217278 n=1 Tax=Hibiscus syriacus TaxID=106335 RepID=UPI0019213D38|nr:uncharacterized protein LOC120217278 [Hibiscus syriacus]